MRDTMIDKLQNKCCICGKNISDAKVKITHEARSMGYGDYNRYYFTCIACADSITDFMQVLRNMFIKEEAELDRKTASGIGQTFNPD